MRGKIAGSVVVVAVAITVFVWLGHLGGEKEPSMEPPASSVEQPDKDDVPSDSDTIEPPVADEERLIQAIIDSAKAGRIEQTPFIAGHTARSNIIEAWGEPDRISAVETGTYEEYASRGVTLGYADHLLVDVRSYHAALADIKYDAILSVGGHPVETRYDADGPADQMILVYDAGEAYQLKWILSNPTDTVPNPAVDHISVVDKEQMEMTSMIGEMSLNEKIGQMMFAGMEGTTLDAKTKHFIDNGELGGLILYANNLTDVEQSVRLLNAIKQENAGRLPLLLGVDQEGGRVERLPGMVHMPANQDIGEKNDPDFSYRIGQLLGEELRAFGFNLDFAPVLDINSNPDNPIIGDRSFGNRPDLVSGLGIQTMKGIQSQNVISVVKHFPGHGDTSVDSHLELPVVDKSYAELRQLEFIPFQAAIEDGADVVMIAHILLPQLDAKFPSSMSKTMITDMLRGELGYNGVVITDDMTMDAIADNFTLSDAVVQAIKAGGDLVLIGHGENNVGSAIAAVKTAVEQGDISEPRINESVRRIIALKRKYELTNDRVDSVDVDALSSAINGALNSVQQNAP